MPELSNNVPRMFTIQEVTEKLKVNRATIKKLIYSGKLKALKIGRVYRISEDSLLEFIKGDEGKKKKGGYSQV